MNFSPPTPASARKSSLYCDIAFANCRDNKMTERIKKEFSINEIYQLNRYFYGNASIAGFLIKPLTRRFFPQAAAPTRTHQLPFNITPTYYKQKIITGICYCSMSHVCCNIILLSQLILLATSVSQFWCSPIVLFSTYLCFVLVIHFLCYSLHVCVSL